MNDEIIQIDKNITIYDLETAKRRIEELSNIRKKLETSEERKMHDYMYSDEINKLNRIIMDGIIITKIPYKEEIQANLINYFRSFNLTEEEIISKINEIEFFLSDILMGYGGKLVHVSNRIGIDISYVTFSEEGYFLNFKEELKDFLIHTITHELLHHLSSKEDDKMVLVLDDPIIEGYTEMFAHYVSGKTQIISERYLFFEKVSMFFTQIIGIEKVINDYLYHNQTHPNLKKIFLECGCDNFSKFENLLNIAMDKTIIEQKEGKKQNFAIFEKQECINFIVENILIPYINKNQEQTQEILYTFNLLFKDYGYNYNESDIKTYIGSIK